MSTSLSELVQIVQDNKNLIVIEKQFDGNYIGYAFRFGKVVFARQADPQIVLQLLLTHSGDGESVSV